MLVYEELIISYINMKDNWNVAILGNKVVLLPYRSKFVLTYHGTLFFFSKILLL